MAYVSTPPRPVQARGRMPVQRDRSLGMPALGLRPPVQTSPIQQFAAMQGGGVRPAVPTRAGAMTSLPNGVRPAGTVHAMGARNAGGVRRQLNALNPQQAAAFRAWIAHASPQGAPAGAGGGGGGGAAGGGGGGGAPALMLPGTVEAGFLGQRNRANENYMSAMENNRFQYGQAQNSYVPRFRDMATAQAEQLRTQPDSFVARGIFDSGVYNRNLTQTLTQQSRAHSDLVGQRSGQLASIRNQRNGIERSRADSIANIEAQRQAAAARYAVGSVK